MPALAHTLPSRPTGGTSASPSRRVLSAGRRSAPHWRAPNAEITRGGAVQSRFVQASIEATPSDGRILPATHWASLVVFVILVPAFVILWGLPARTADAWAWTIVPNLTPIFMGAGYGAGAYFFLRTFLGRVWYPSSAGVFGAAFFAGLMLIATMIHWDRFNHGDAPLIGALVFYGWVGVYVVSPFAVVGLWLRNRRTDSGEPAPGEAVVPDRARIVAGIVGIGALAAGAVFLISPQTMIDIWGWELTPLTARVVGCFTAQAGAGALLLSTDRRWGAWRLIVQTFFVATALLLIGALREWDEFDTDRVMTWLYLGGLVTGDAALALLYRSMSTQEGNGRSAGRTDH
jgi:hypothetical protein